MKKIKYSLFLLVFFMFFGQNVFANDYKYLDIYVKGEYWLREEEPVINHGRVLLPLRDMSEKLDFEVFYDSDLESVSLEKSEKIIKINLNSKEAFVNDEKIMLDTVALNIDGTVFLPLRFVAEALGERVYWDADNRIAMVSEFELSAPANDSIEISNEIYAVNIPLSWKDKVIVEKEGSRISFYDKQNYNVHHGGHIFTIEQSLQPITTIIPGVILNYNPSTKIYTEARFTSDVQYDLNDPESYLTLVNEKYIVIKTFRFIEK